MSLAVAITLCRVGDLNIIVIDFAFRSTLLPARRLRDVLLRGDAGGCVFGWFTLGVKVDAVEAVRRRDRLTWRTHTQRVLQLQRLRWQCL